jgi:hypothetical protein
MAAFCEIGSRHETNIKEAFISNPLHWCVLATDRKAKLTFQRFLLALEKRARNLDHETFGKEQEDGRKYGRRNTIF